MGPNSNDPVEPLNRSRSDTLRTNVMTSPRVPCHAIARSQIHHAHPCSLRTDILPLKQESKIIRYIILQGCIKSQHCLSVRFVGIASPPVQCSNIGLKMRNKKCEIFIHPSNIWLSYSPALEQGCLERRKDGCMLTRSLLILPTGCQGYHSTSDFSIRRVGITARCSEEDSMICQFAPFVLCA